MIRVFLTAVLISVTPFYAQQNPDLGKNGKTQLNKIKFSKNTEKENPNYEGKIVIFFGPNESERDEIIKSKEPDIDVILDDLNYYADVVCSMILQYSISTDLTSLDTIKLRWGNKIFKFARPKGDGAVGVILSDGVKKPKIIFGVTTDIDLLPEINKYFGVKCKPGIR